MLLVNPHQINYLLSVGESMDAEAMILIMDYKEVDGVEKPCILAFKHGLEEEKC